MNYRAYNRLLLGGLAAVAVFLCGTTFYLQPIVGDLTRLGGYTENDFGWNGEQEVFEPALALSGNLSEHYDIVVVGDSFSSRTTPDRQTPNGGFWTDFLAEMTGLSVGVFDLDRTSLEKVLAGPAYLAAPPKLVVYESVERALDIRFPGAGQACQAKTPQAAVIERHPRGLLPKRVQRNTFRSLNEMRFNQTIDYLKKGIRRWFGRNDPTPVLRVSLSRADLFTHKRSFEMLLIADDLGKKRWTVAQMAKIRCTLHRYQKEVEANGTTRFVALIAPDKSTIYGEYLPPTFAMPHVCPILSADAALQLVCVDAALMAAVASGTKDVYLPNDTHWASPGAKIAAQAVARYVAHDRGGQH